MDPKHDYISGDTGFVERLGNGDIAAAVKAGMNVGGVKALTIEGIPYMAVPDGMELASFEGLLPQPKRIKVTREFEEPDSFYAYVDTFNDPRTRLFGNSDELKIIAILDDHQRDEPAWAEHVAVLKLKLSPEWTEWENTCTKPLTQQDLADFLDDHMEQIAEPDSSDLLSDIRQIHITTNTRCESVQREGGDIAFSFATETAGGTKTERGRIPHKLVLLIAPFRSWTQVQAVVTLTYRLTSEKQLLFQMRMHQADALVLNSFTDVRKYVEGKLEAPVLI